MIQTGFESRVKIQQIIENQLPEFILDESPKFIDFLKQYYISQEYQSGPVDIAENLDQYLKLDNLTPEVVVDNTFLQNDINSTVGIITVTSTKGFPQTYGLLKIDDEVITYTGITTNTFTGCIRGFSGITNYHNDLNQEELIFSKTISTDHKNKSSIQNLSSLFLKEFYKKLKYTFVPGLEEVDFVSNLNVGNFIREVKSLYQSKGTNESFRILFNVLYGVNPRVVNLEEFLIKPSSAQFIRREIVIAERISGDPSKLIGQSIKKSSDTITSASISEIEPFLRNNRQYYKISLFVGYTDVSAVEGNFTITPSTRCLETVSIGSSVISVDSTIGFAGIGTIISGNNTITYQSKSINQFFGCIGITSTISSTNDVRSDEFYYGYENGDTSKKVELRLTGVLSKFVQTSDSLNLDEGQIIFVKTIGDLIKNPETNQTYKEIFANSWIYNTRSRYQIKDGSTNYTLVSPIDRSSLKIGDEFQLLNRGSNVGIPTANITKINSSENSIGINLGTLNANQKYDIRRKLNTASSLNVPIKFGNNTVLSDIQNLYVDDDYAYVASNSLPSNGNDLYTYNITTKIKSLLGIGLTDNYTLIQYTENSSPFITGDRVYYQPSGTPIVGLDTGDYYVENISDPKGIRLYYSKSFIGSNNYITFKDSSFNNNHKFTLYSQKSEIIGPQKLLKKFPLVENIDTGNGEITLPGPIGMLINGVEISNYKSNDKIYYGPLESINVLNGGSNFDVINPPIISISSGIGVTALVNPVISGSIQKVYIDSQDYDIDKIVSIGVSGGNGSGAVLQPIVTKRQRSILFDGRLIENSGGISSTTRQLTFINNHNLNNGEPLIYNSNGNLGIGIGTTPGTLVNEATYYVKIDNNKTIRLYQSNSDYNSGINTVSFNAVNTSGIHKFRTASYKNTVSEIKVLNGGEYTNRKLIVSPTGISTSYHSVTFKNHAFKSGELVNYNYQTSTIGISTLPQYYILNENENSFKLCDAGIGGTNTDNYNRKNYVRFSSSGSGYQYFSYPDISVSILYSPVGFGTTTQEYKSLIATPIVKGKIIDTYLYESGTGYGSSILNLEKKPIILIKNGKEAQLKPIIINGEINSVNIQYGGKEYYSIPDLIIEDYSGSGSGADLRPVIANGKISDIKIVNSGIGYSSTSTIIKVKSSGSNAVFDTKIRSLTVNHNQKFGDEFLFERGNELHYSVSGYFEKLRTSFNDNGSVSKIIGWSYDGNPIYGPYGYTDPENSNSIPKLLSSGYELEVNNIIDRPEFPAGFFVEDYTYTNSGDLDENNGRFGKTPEFPNGVYAYFATLDSVSNPKFPYFIGDKYRTNTLEENLTLDQSFDFNNSDLLRNTLPYKISDDYADNDFIIETSEFTNQESVVESVTSGNVNEINIINPGSNYKVNDVLNFDDKNTGGGGLIARVSSISGKDIVKLDTTVQTYENSIFTWNNDNQVKVTILPYHDLLNGDFVVISGFSTSLNKLNNSYKIGLSSYYSNVLKNIPSSTAGFSTEIYITQIPIKVSVGSSISIGSEKLKVLEVFENLNIIKVQRGSTGISHTATTKINFIPDSFTISEKIDYFDSKVNNKVFFNPTQSVGVGTIAGITSSITFKFGDSNITRIVPTQGIYIENHPFAHNEYVVLTLPSPISISTSPTGNEFSIPTNVYVSNKNKNTIGIKTNLTSSEIYFRNNGDNNNNYSIESQYSQIKGRVERIKSVVSVSTYHGLINNDVINLEVKPNLSVGVGTSVSVYVKRYLNTGNILINPIGFNSTGINTSTNTITINSHNLKTGDKILYSSNVLPSGLTTDFYYVYKINDNSIKLSQTYLDSKNSPPSIVSIASTGGSNQSISLVNPQIKIIRNNNLVFNLSDSSLSGYKFKLYYDKNYKNEFVSIATTSAFTLSGIGTVGVSSTASITINYNEEIPTKLYYNLEKFGSISTTDTSVNNYSEILFENSEYNSTYNISGIGSTTFSISLTKIPEKLTYSQNECDILRYNTTSISAKGPIHKINIVSGGSGYKKFPIFIGSNSQNGEDAYVVPKSKTIGNVKELRIINEGFEYSSDKTLQPIAYISPLITIKNSNTIDSITVINGGKGYTDAPNISIVNSTTGEKINSGILNAKLSGNSIDSVNIIQYPKGLPEKTVRLVAENNTNGVSIQRIESSSSGIFTCYITTPTINGISTFITSPFSGGDKVFVEGIIKIGSNGSGFNSEDYNYQFFNVTNYNNSGLLDKVTIDISGLTTNTGIAKTIQDSISNIIKSTDYPEFKVSQTPSFFNVGEKLSSKGVSRDLKIISTNNSFIKVFGSYSPSIEEIIVGNETGNIATIDEITYSVGKFKVDYSVEKNLGWFDDIGKLSQDNQVIPDNDYYQNLSYTVKSPITYQNSKTQINSLLHTSGLKNFSDTGITSTSKSGILTSRNAMSVVYDIIEENRVDTIYDFDLALDIDVVGNSSKFLKLKTKKLSDYIECKTNVVLKIDDISRQFSNLDGEPSEFINLIELNSTPDYNNILVRVSNYDNSQIQLSELIILNDTNNSFIAEKSTIANSGIGLTHIPGEEYGSFSIVKNDSGKSYLQFIPDDPYSTDYDIKFIKSNFNSSDVGIGTTSIGFINLTGSNIINASSGISTSIISVDSSKFSSLLANVQVTDSTANLMNFVEVYLKYDGTNTYISEYYFDSESSSNYSGNFIGTFGSNISSGILSLNYKNNSANIVNIRSRIVGFGTTAIGVGAHRFILPNQIVGNERSAIYQSTYSSTVSSASTIISLNKSNFNAIKSLVDVSVGSTNALHQIMMIHDNNNIYVQQSPFLSIGSTSGIGTFGGEYSGNNFELKFYPDSGINSEIKILSFNQCLYSTLDSLNIAPNFTYGTVTDSIDIIFYNAINGDRINRLDFDLKSDDIPIFAKTFNPEDSLILNPTTGVFTIENHFFSPSEELIYTPKSTFIGVGASSVGIGSTLNSVGIVTTLLPSDVYVIRTSENKFKLSTRKDYAALGIGVTFTSVGLGNVHQLEMKKKNEKVLITIDNIVQYPLLFTPISHSLSENNGQISATSSIFSLSGISTIVPRDILKIDNEYMGIINVGLGTTSIGPITNNGSFNLIEVKRGFVGSSATSHTDSTEARIYKGSYNIVNNKIFFSESPRGNPQIERDSSNLIFETSDFTGRVFLRNNYTSNQIYDDISSKFTGIGRTFTLTVGGANTVGLGSTGGNGILFINGVFQTPTTLNNPQNNFKIIENSGISSVIFSGITSSNSDIILTSEFDVNQNQTPRGGIIVSLGSSSGLGYAPLVGANVFGKVGVGGSIISIVSTATTGSAFAISTATYHKTTGLLDVTTTTPHQFAYTNVKQVTLIGLQFSCPVNESFLTTVTTTGQTVGIGSTVIFVDSVSDVSIGSSISITGKLTNIPVVSVGNTFVRIGTSSTIGSTIGSGIAVTFSTHYSGITTTIFPEGVTGIGKTFTIKSIGTTTSFTIDAGISTIPHNYVGQGTVFSFYGDLTPGSGYNGIVAIGVSVYQSGHIGDTAIITASVGAGGTLSFTVGAGGTGYTNPQIFVSEPSYENLNVVGVSRLGIGATTKTGIGLLLNVEVGASSTTGIGSTYFEVSKFNISRQGYSFQRGDVFKPVGLVTAKGLNSPLSEFKLTVIDTFSDSFAAWQFGQFDFIDSIKNYQDGVRTRFSLFYNDELLSFEKLEGSIVNLSNALLIIINGVIQDPETAYVFDGGTSFAFTTAPKTEDNVAIFFYKGTAGDDTSEINDIKETLQRGDVVQVLKNNSISKTITQDKRTVFDISGSDRFETNLYSKQGVDSNNYKPLSWIKQKVDQKINGELFSKSRDSLESLVFPTAKIIGDFSTTDTQIFVDNSDFFKYGTPNLTDALIVSGSLDTVSAGITAVVSGLGTVQSLIINNPGSGYTGNLVTLKISPPPVILEKIGNVIVGVGSTAIATITVGAGGTLTTPITITNPGFGYLTSKNNYHPFPTDGYAWATQQGNTQFRSIISQGIVSAGSTLGNTPLQMIVTGDDPHIITYNSPTYNIALATKGQTWTFSVYAKANELTTGELFLFEANSSGVYIDFTMVTIDIKTDWKRFSITRPIINSNTSFVQVRVDGTPNYDSGNGKIIWWDGFQVERSSTVGIFTSGSTTTALSIPKVIAPLPDPIYENISTINTNTITGFSGIITGITTTEGIGGNPLALKFNLTGPSGYSGLQIGYPIYIFDTRIGSGLTSINNSNSAIVGIGTTFLDNIYIISAFSSSGTSGIITCNILSTTSVVGLASTGNTSNPVGKYSWGKLSGFSRSSSPISIGVTGNTIDVGLSTFPTIQRRKSGLRKTGALSKLL